MNAQLQLLDHLLLLAAVVCAATLVRLLRRSEGIGRGYAWVVGALLLGTIWARGDQLEATVVICLVVATVVIPWVLEHASRSAFARGRLIWVARLSSLRASLMLGGGLARQLPILDGLAALERDGVDAALAHFRQLADEAEDADEIALIHEQIIAMLFHGQRWDEGIAHYERRFRSGYAAARPGLALGLLRAYGEAGRLEHAAGLLRELEDGPIGSDPNTIELIGQARLTFLAYAGAVAPVDEIVARGRFDDLGLSPATAELFLGIAHARAGEALAARATLEKVESLAGPRDRRAREAARAVLERVGLLPIELEPELRIYVELVAARLRRLVESLPPLRRYERPRATYVVIVGLSVAFGMHLLRQGGGMGLLELGALSRDLWLAGGRGAWARPLTAAWLHADVVGLLFDVYSIWLAGQIVERLLGPLRMVLVSVGAALLGMVASVMALPLLEPELVELARVAPTGGNLMAVGAIMAALLLLAPSKTPALSPRSRRNLTVTLALLLLANVLMSWPTAVGVTVAPVALLTAMLFSSLVVLGLPRLLPRAATFVLGLGLGVMLLANAAALVVVALDDPQAYLVDHRIKTCELGGVELHTPMTMVPMSFEHEAPFELPIVDGLLDSLELRDGSLVQLAVVRGASEADELALFELAEGLEHELSVTAVGTLPEPFAELFADDRSGSWRAADLWRNGERIGRVIERRLESADPAEAATVVLVASPVEAIEHAPAVYAAIMREAAASRSGLVSRRVQCEP